MVELSTDLYRNVDMIQVGIWADTGTIEYCQPSGYYGDIGAQPSIPTPSALPPQSSPSQAAISANDTSNTFVIIGITVAVIAIATIAVFIKRRKR